MSELAELTDAQTAVLEDLQAVFPDERLVVIGAVGLGCHFPMTWRRTNDFDLTLAVELEPLDLLAVRDGWQRDARLPYRFDHRSGLRVDLLPAAERHVRAGELVFAATGQVMNLTGFDLALRHSVPRRIGPTGTAWIATVPAIVLLKMAAFLDRPYERERDLEDLSALFEAYLSPDDDRRFDPPIVDAGVEFPFQPAMALGLDVAAIVESSHRALVNRFLSVVGSDGPHRA